MAVGTAWGNNQWGAHIQDAAGIHCDHLPNKLCPYYNKSAVYEYYTPPVPGTPLAVAQKYWKVLRRTMWK
jgi:hypothetical protein